MTGLTYGLYTEETQGTFLGYHDFIHMLAVPMFALLALGVAEATT